MKKITLLLVCLLSITISQAQKKAVTETGEEIIIFEDGTWEYQDKESEKETEIPTNSKKFKKTDASTFLLKSSKIKLGFWLNPKEWTFKKSVENPDAEYEFKFKKDDLYAMVITEKFEIPLKQLKTIALENGRSIAPDLKIVKEEYRMVNGIKVMLLQMNGTMQGIKVSYYGYYYSNESGTVQFITYTSQNLIDVLKVESEKLLNGIVELK